MSDRPARTRDHLANERTYLAWMRTSISLIGFGLVIARLRYLLAPDAPGTGTSWGLGMMLVGMGLITVVVATSHYFATQYAIEHDSYRTNRRWVVAFSSIVLLMGSGVVFILVRTLNSPTRLEPESTTLNRALQAVRQNFKA